MESGLLSRSAGLLQILEDDVVSWQDLVPRLEDSQTGGTGKGALKLWPPIPSLM